MAYLLIGMTETHLTIKKGKRKDGQRINMFRKLLKQQKIIFTETPIYNFGYPSKHMIRFDYTVNQNSKPKMNLLF